MKLISQALGTKLDFMAVSHPGYKADPTEEEEEVLSRAWLGTSLFAHPLPRSTKMSLLFELPGEKIKSLPAQQQGGRAVSFDRLLCNISLALENTRLLRNPFTAGGHNHPLRALHKEPIN